MRRYNPKDIEPKWQKVWDETGTYAADLQSDKPKYIAMSMFNYPSGAGIHIGHAMNYTISDVKARFKRQQGFESYHPVGWDAFGLPAENYAIKAGVSPQESMANIIPDYHKQYKAMGWSNDWEKEISTHLPEYYKWTQWIFTQMHKNGLAYQDSRMQWWCSIDNTVLANEQVIDGKCWRHDGADDPLVEKKEVKQWFFKITDYADELLEAIDDLDWTESVKLAQKNWIGKSVGAEVVFKVKDSDEAITVFTTRPDTLFGATFLVLAPENELVAQLTTDEQKAEVEKYIAESAKKTEVERQASKEKTGVFTGAYAINPANNKEVPIWIADYVLNGYGTGAIMAVPAHDERDHAFAQKFGLPVVPVVTPSFVFGEVDMPAAVDRLVAIAVAHDPATDKYCVIEWQEGHHRAGVEWPGGGIDEGETIEQGALREFTEETGYTDVSIEKVLPAAISFYYTSDVSGPRRGVKNIVKLRINSLTHNGIVGTEDYEKDTYEVKWLSRDEVLASQNRMDASFQAITEFALDETVHVGEGVMINSVEYNNLSSDDVRDKIVTDLKEKSLAKEKVNYKMRDWSVSRQRYWGAPIPIIHCPKDGAVLVPNESLPVVLPELDDFQPSGDGRSALARAKDWLKVDCPKCGGPAERETDTLDTYICSSWYMYRYLDPHNQHAIFDSAVVKKWEPIDFYNGADHATAHLLYARFIGHFFKKLGLVDEPEPFKQFLFNGKVTAQDGTMFSKSKGNGIDPLEIIDQGYGADALRTYLMFAAPLELWAKWDPQGVPGTHRFLSRIWTLVQEYHEAAEGETSPEQQKELLRITHRTIKKMTEDLEHNAYNTAIAAAMTMANDLYKQKAEALAKNDDWKQALQAIVACVAPFAPHISEELWHQLGHSTTVHKDSWPKWEEKYLTQDTVTIAVQVNGKVRGEITVPADVNEEAAIKAAQENEKVKVHTSDKQIVKTIYVPGKIVNLVVR